MIVLNQGLDHAVYDFEYDLYGNITKSKGPENYTGQRFFHQYTYDDNIKTYPVKVQDAFGYSSKTQYDFRFGLPTLTEDMNLQPMKYVYDAKARTTEIVGPYEMFNNIPWTIKFEYNPLPMLRKMLPMHNLMQLLSIMIRNIQTVQLIRLPLPMEMEKLFR